MKKIKETTRPRITGDFIGGGGPSKPSRRNIASLSNYSGSPTLPADTGGTFMNRLYPDNYFDFLEEDEFEKEEKEVLSENAATNLLQSALYSIPTFGDFIAVLRCLYVIFNPISGLNVKSKRFTKKLSRYTNIPLGNDFLEPEGSIHDEDVLDERLEAVIEVLRNPEMYESSDSLYSLNSIVESYKDILSQVQQAFICTFGAADFFYKQKNIFVNAGISVLKPEEVANFALDKYAKMFEQELEQVTDLDDEKQKADLLEKTSEMVEKAGDAIFEFISSFSEVIDKMPLIGGIIGNISGLFKKVMSVGDKFGHLDLLFNKRKLKRLSLVNDALRIAKNRIDNKVDTLQSKKIKRSTIVKNEDQPLAPTTMSLKSILDWLIKFLFESKNHNRHPSLKILMEDYINNEEKDDNILFDDEIDEYDLEEYSGVVAGGGGPALPVGKKINKLDITEKAINEQRERIRKLQAYHQKTTNRLK